jgi:flagellar biosynthesis protein FlhF
MKLKSYFSGTVEAAMELARQELGEEALLVNARPATPETRYLGAYEVVFGTPPKAGGPAGAKVHAGEAAAATAAASAASSSGVGDRAVQEMIQEISQLKREFERMSQSLLQVRRAQTPAPAAVPLLGTSVPASADTGPSAELYTRLLAQELDPILAQAVAAGTPLENLFEVDATLGRPGAARAVVAVVGPPGVGKTTTLVKLAARYGLAARKPAQILSADVFRIAAADQLRSLASILGIGCEIAETAGALAQMLEEHRSKELVFVDTPGLGRADMEDAEDLARLIATHPEIDTHLVLPASMRPADLERAIDRYAVFEPRKLLFTRMDETSTYGLLVSQAARRELPLSFLATGQQIPDDLEVATKPRLAELVAGTVRSAVRSRGAAA